MTSKPFRYRHNFSFIIATGLFLSITNAVWAFLLSIAKTANGDFAVVALIMVLGQVPIAAIVVLLRKERVVFSFYPVVTGVLYGLANVLLLSIFSFRNSAVVYSLISPTIIVFIIAEIFINRKKIIKRNVKNLAVGGGIAGIGFFVLSLSGLNLSIITPYDIFLSIILIVLYGLAGFFFTQTGLKSGKTYFPIIVIDIFEIVTILPFLLFYRFQIPINGLTIAFLAGLVVSVGIIISFVGYGTLEKSRKAIPYSSVMYILSEMETLFLLLFYSIFVRILNLYIIGSILLIILAIWYLSKESDASFS